MVINKVDRSSKFEVLRIISMILIINFHIYIYTGNDLSKTAFSLNFLLSSVLGLWGILGVDIFILISSYYLIDKKNEFKTEKLLKIIVETIFYSLVLLSIFSRTGVVKITIKEIIKSIISPISGEYWYVFSYCMLYMIYPFLNEALKKVEIKNLKKFIYVYSIFLLMRMLKNNVDISGVDIFIYIYCVMFYLKYNKDNWLEKNCKKGFIITTIVIYLGTISINFIGTKFNINLLLENTKIFVTRSSLLILLDAIFLFYIFKGINIKNNKIINSFSNTTLGIYILHENRFTREYLWNNILKMDYYYFNNNFFALKIIFVSFGMFFIFSIIDFIRIKVLEPIIFSKKNYLVKKCCKKIDDFYNG